MWIKKLEITNIKCFDKLELSFEHPTRKLDPENKEPEPYRWITLLGENGAGKSTVLQCAGLLLAGPEAASDLLSRPHGWLKDRAAPSGGKIKITIHQDTQEVSGADQKTSEMDQGVYDLRSRARDFTYSYYVTGYEPIKVQNIPYREPQIVMERSTTLNWLRTNALYSGAQGWFAAGYGPFRRLSKKDDVIAPTLPSIKRSSNFLSLFNEDEPISSYEQWLAYLESQKDRSGEDIQKALELIHAILPELLPRQQDYAGQEQKITPEGVDERNRARLRMSEREIISSPGWADGFRSVVAFAGDLIWRLFSTFPHLADITKASGVVLVDELDTHLHPSWQRYIPSWLQKTFPNLQFIVSTHSPMIAAGAGSNALTLHFFWKENKIRYEKVEEIWFYDVDEILRSPAFRLGSTHAPEMAEKIVDYKQLRTELYRLENSQGKEAGETANRIAEIQSQMKILAEDVRKANLGIPEPGSIEERVQEFLLNNLPETKKLAERMNGKNRR